MIFKFPKDPNGADEILFSKTKVDIKPGLTVLTGCNGSGKTTFLHLVKKQLEKNKIRYVYFDNCTMGHTHAMSERLFMDDLQGVASLMFHSEGERLVDCIGGAVCKIGRAVHTAQDDSDLFVLLDACDSGLSVDQIQELKDCFDLIIKDAKERSVTVYILMASNAYETVYGERSLDVSTFKEYCFTSYDAYRDYIVNVSRKYKDNRLQITEKEES